MPRNAATGLALLSLTIAATPAAAVVQGSMSGLSAYTVRLVGNGFCTGVAISRRAVVTAAHCARGMRVVADGSTIRIAGVSRSAVLDDGRRVHASGDAAILKLAEPLPFGVSAAPIGNGAGDSFTIAGYGTADESAGGGFGALRQANLVAASRGALVDPNRQGEIGASACFGDSGGPVMRGGLLVGVITRAAYPNRRIACGDLTRWAPVTATGSARAAVPGDDGGTLNEPRQHKRHHHVRHKRHTRHKTARR
jgi:Trypsin